MTERAAPRAGPEVARQDHQHDKRNHNRRNRIEFMFGRLKDWRRVAT